VSSGRPSRPTATASRPSRRPSSSRTRFRASPLVRRQLAIAPVLVALATAHIVEHRTLTLPSGQVVPRALTTYVRYPREPRKEPKRDQPLPLIVFAHGFDVTLAPYVALLTAWARAGFVVAAPVMPLENANAPGGATQSDLVNEPGDMTAVITWLIRRSRTPGSPFYGLINPNEIAVAGHSDGGAAALAMGYGAYARDFRVRADIVMSGSEVPDFGYYNFAPGTPPLLATQGTADTTNLPGNTFSYFTAASRPKFLLQLLGAGHLPPYATEQPQLRVVERTTTAFLYRYLLHSSQALARLESYGNFAGVAALGATP
jgi:hypothetical protein